MRIVKASTALGKRLIQTGQQWQGTFLNQVYDKWSAEKEEDWNKFYDEYCNTDVHIIVLALRFHGLHLKE